MTKILIDRATVQQALEACPFCGNEPSFSGNASDWKDESRYVELSLGCCVSMTEQIGWRRARDMTHEAKTAELQNRLRLKWNTRAALEQPEPPPEAQTEAEKIAYCAGWWAAMEQKREQPEQEPVAWRYQSSNTGHVYLVWEKGTGGRNWTPLYTHPLRRTWQGLTEEEREQATGWSVEHIEARLKEKNT